MQSFSEITNGAQILGLVPGNKPVWIITTVPIGVEAVTVYYKNESGKPEEQIVYQKDLHRLSIAEKELAWSFTADATNFQRLRAPFVLALYGLGTRPLWSPRPCRFPTRFGTP